MARLPTLYLPHGGGPWPFVDVFGPKSAWQSLEEYLRGIVTTLPEKPRGILCISAHWEEAEPTLMTAKAPPMLYDYYGFPEAAYAITWPAPGLPEIEGRVSELLARAGFRVGKDDRRGFDHGTFVPLKLAIPGADIPTTQLSLVRGLDPKLHYELGRALAPLRDEGIFLVGSGSSYHNMRGFGSRQGAEASVVFDDWLGASMLLPREERRQALLDWANAPAGRAAHPREEHLLPLHVVAGAGEDSEPSLPYRGSMIGTRVSAVQFG